MLIRVLGAIACGALLLPLAACGGNDDEKATEAVAKSLRSGGNDFGLSAKEADCAAEKLVANVGTEDLVEYKILTKDLEMNDDTSQAKMSKSDANGAADALIDCVGSSFVRDVIGNGLDEKVVDCLEKELSDKQLRSFLAALFTQDGNAARDLLVKPMTACAQQGATG